MKSPLARLAVTLAGVATIGLFVPSARADSVTLNASSTAIESIATGSAGSDTKDTHAYPTMVPESGSTGKATEGSNSANTNYNFTSTDLNETYSLAEDGDYDQADTDSQIYFSVAADTSYLLAGSLTEVGGGAKDNYVDLQVILQDLTTNTILFENGQTSEMTNNASFTLGQQHGDSSNDLSGSISGVLVAGDQYEWSTDGTIEQLINLEVSATATGSFDLYMPAPLPRSACAGLLLLAALAIAKRPSAARKLVRV
ncbi:MAG TPA: hypothetical protein VMD30_06545 [Tepidisphaeraceae bacterium]|nr:hypothetical protein [Tepidisphaeraceae bacterium]